jgi:hypothetical protein
MMNSASKKILPNRPKNFLAGAVSDQKQAEIFVMLFFERRKTAVFG